MLHTLELSVPLFSCASDARKCELCLRNSAFLVHEKTASICVPKSAGKNSAGHSKRNNILFLSPAITYKRSNIPFL